MFDWPNYESNLGVTRRPHTGAALPRLRALYENAEPPRLVVPVRVSAASLILVAMYGEPPRSGWLSSMIFRWASLISGFFARSLRARGHGMLSERGKGVEWSGGLPHTKKGALVGGVAAAHT